jgi:hypothetical protein
LVEFEFTPQPPVEVFVDPVCCGAPPLDGGIFLFVDDLFLILTGSNPIENDLLQFPLPAVVLGG